MARFDARNVISFYILALVFGAQMCANDSDVVYLTVSARIAGTCAVNISPIDLSVAVLTVRRGRMHIFLSFFDSSLAERLTVCAATLFTAAMFGKSHVTDRFLIDRLDITVQDIYYFHLVWQRESQWDLRRR